MRNLQATQAKLSSARAPETSIAPKVAKVSHRVDAIEGLRGYLALWVLVCHVLWATGIDADELTGVLLWIRNGELAVDVFMIVSGFAITLCLHTQQATYKQFVVRRFWRLFPAFIVVFAASLPISWLSLWNANHATQYLTPAQAQSIVSNIQGWWDNVMWHVPLHLSMLHGLVPDIFVVGSPGAFLTPAWSISLEWQFYLVAPVAYALAVSKRPLSRLALAGVIAYMMWAARYVLPPVAFGAALPFHVGFFALGAASYFAYVHRSVCPRPNVWFPLGACAAAVLYWIYHLTVYWVFIPIALWIGFLGLLLESPTTYASRLILPLFTNRLSQYWGRISYSVYLSHILVIAVLQHLLLEWVPNLGRSAHFSVLLLSTLAATTGVSILLYRFVETPGIQIGRTLSRHVAKRQISGELQTRV